MKIDVPQFGTRVMKILVQNPTHLALKPMEVYPFSQNNIFKNEIIILSFYHTLAYPEIPVPDCFQVMYMPHQGKKNQTQNLAMHFSWPGLG